MEVLARKSTTGKQVPGLTLPCISILTIGSIHRDFTLLFRLIRLEEASWGISDNTLKILITWFTR